MSRPGQSNSCVARRPAQSLIGPDLGEREDDDDDQVRRVGARARRRASRVARRPRARRTSASCAASATARAGDRRAAPNRALAAQRLARAARRAGARRSRRPRAARRRCRSARPRCSSSTRTGRSRTRGRRPARPARPGATPRQPSTMPTRISGTISARNGVWRPTIAPRSSFGRSVSPASVMIGIAIAPNATGAVLATSATDGGLHRLEAERRSSITAVIATGVPKPASASSSAPKQKAMITAWMRWSSEIAVERAPQHGEVPGLVGHVVDPDRVEDDPHDREQAERGALERRRRAPARPASSRR